MVKTLSMAPIPMLEPIPWLVPAPLWSRLRLRLFWSASNLDSDSSKNWNHITLTSKFVYKSHNFVHFMFLWNHTNLAFAFMFPALPFHFPMLLSCGDWSCWRDVVKHQSTDIRVAKFERPLNGTQYCSVNDHVSDEARLKDLKSRTHISSKNLGVTNIYWCWSTGDIIFVSLE